MSRVRTLQYIKVLEEKQYSIAINCFTLQMLWQKVFQQLCKIKLFVNCNWRKSMWPAEIYTCVLKPKQMCSLCL